MGKPALILPLFTLFFLVTPVTGLSKPFFAYLKMVLTSEFKAISCRLSHFSRYCMDTHKIYNHVFPSPTCVLLQGSVSKTNSERGKIISLFVVVTQHVARETNVNSLHIFMSCKHLHRLFFCALLLPDYFPKLKGYANEILRFQK